MIYLCARKLIEFPRKPFYFRTVRRIQIKHVNFADRAYFPKRTEDRPKNFGTERVVQVNHQIVGRKAIVRRVRVDYFRPTTKTLDVSSRSVHKFSCELNADKPFERETRPDQQHPALSSPKINESEFLVMNGQRRQELVADFRRRRLVPNACGFVPAGNVQFKKADFTGGLYPILPIEGIIWSRLTYAIPNFANRCEPALILNGLSNTSARPQQPACKP